MFRILFCLIHLGSLITFPARADDEGLRVTENFNRDWKFQLGDPTGAAAAGIENTSIYLAELEVIRTLVAQ